MLAPAFNVFRLAGDLLHVISIILLWTKMQSTRSCAGISLKSQMLYMLVYVSRYLDLLHFTSFELAHFYNFIMKCLFLASQGAVIYYMMYRFRSTYIAKLDTVRVEFIIVPCLVLAYTFLDLRPGGGAFYVFNEYFWTFSILLESVAILPQMFLLSSTGEADAITTHYLLCLGLYRGFYLLNWIYRYIFHKPPESIVVWAGILQTALYSDFFYIYYKRVFSGRAFKLPI